MVRDRPPSCTGGAWPTGRRPVLGGNETRNLAALATERAWWSRLSPSGEPERAHFLGVAHQQDVADQHRVVPGLALYCRRPRPLGGPRGRRVYQRQVSLLAQDEEQVLVGQQQELPLAVAAPLPGTLIRLDVDAGQDAAVEAVGRVPCAPRNR